MSKLPRVLVGSVQARHKIAAAYEAFINTDGVLMDLTLFEVFMAGWDAGRADLAEASPLESELLDILRYIREQAPEAIGGEPYTISAGSFYKIDLLFKRPEVAALLPAPTQGAGVR